MRRTLTRRVESAGGRAESSPGRQEVMGVLDRDRCTFYMRDGRFGVTLVLCLRSFFMLEIYQ